MIRNLKSALAALALLGILAPVARADSFGISFGRKTKHGSISIGYSTGASYGRTHKVHCAPRVWVPAHYETRCEKVWVEGFSETIWVEPVFEWRYDSCGRAFRFCVSGGHYRLVKSPGHYVSREVQVWVPGGWRDA